MYLLCAATELEIAPFRRFLAGSGREKDWNVLVTGVGLLPAAVRISRWLAVHRPAFVLQAGVAGSLDPTLPLGSAWLVGRERPGDAGVLENGRFRTLSELGLQPPGEAPWEGDWLPNDPATLSRFGLPVRDGVTVQEITTAPGRMDLYRGWSAALESLEGAALHFAARLEGIPFLQVRTLSNYVGERDKRAWKLAEAVRVLNDTLQHLITQHFPV
ncbi:MAG TPA: futalosine hydrolase [Chitinophagaceae bacterium]|jgi:futalosine hydrolase|nr:futalosine hydrolase [Chitinophagaceae bacterium]